MPSLQDALTDAFDSQEAGELETPVEASIEINDDPISRDDRGRFSLKSQPEEKQAQVVQSIETLIEAAPIVESRKPPQSWAKEQWDRWGKLDKDTQDYIDKRESDFARGVSTYKSQWDQAAPLYQAVQPFLPELQRNNIAPEQWISNLGNAHRTLAMGSPEQKVQMFAKLATDYGVNLGSLQGQPVDQQFGHLAQEVASLRNAQAAQDKERTQSEQARINHDIEAFKSNAPYFESVRETMGQLLQSGVASDLKTAYDKAIRLNDDIWSQHQAEQAKVQATQRQAEIAKKKAAAVSPRSASPTGAMNQGNAKRGLRESLSESFDAVSSGRF